jgi:hypothetical protein
MSYWDIIRPPEPVGKGGKGKTAKPPSAETIRAALAEATIAATAASERAAALAEQRAQLLLSAGDDELDGVERSLQLAVRESDRCDACALELERLLAEAVAREHREQLDRVHATGQAALARGLDLYRRDYAEHALALREVVRAMAAASEEIEAANRALRLAHDPRQIPDLDTSARPQTTPVRQAIAPPWVALRLPSSVHPWCALYPIGIDAIGMPVPAAEWPDR